MNICEYGCGQIATHQFKNGKWCCSKSWQQCPGKKESLIKNFEKEYEIPIKKIPVEHNPSRIEYSTIRNNEEDNKLTRTVIDEKQYEKTDVFDFEKEKEIPKKVILKENKAPEQIISDSIITETELKPSEPPAKIIKETIIPPTKKAVEKIVPKKESLFKRIKNWFIF